MHGGVTPQGGVLFVLGTRPEAIKLAPVVRAVADRGIAVTLCTTGQHRDLAREALAVFGLVADLDLDLMRDAQTPAGVVAAALPLIGGVVARTRPEMVVVQGDTASALAGALAASYARVPLAHVEAGLRSHAAEPFPEDMHRRVIAQLATLHLAPTATAAAALAREGVAGDAIVVTGNPVIDALHDVATRAPAGPVPARPLVVVTAHRRENHGAATARIAEAVALLAARGDAEVAVLQHPHPASGAVFAARLGGTTNVRLLPPLAYPEFVALLRRARLVLTDSGGVQEEAPAFGVPVLVLREATERPEGVAAGVARLVGTDVATIVAAARALLDDPAAHAAMATSILPYGDGRAAERIAAAVVATFAPTRSMPATAQAA